MNEPEPPTEEDENDVAPTEEDENSTAPTDETEAESGWSITPVLALLDHDELDELPDSLLVTLLELDDSLETELDRLDEPEDSDDLELLEPELLADDGLAELEEDDEVLELDMLCEL